VGQELAGAPLAFADQRRRADRGRDRERHHDRHRSEQVDGECVRGAPLGGGALDVALRRLRQHLQCIRGSLHDGDVTEVTDHEQQDRRQDHEEDRAEGGHRHPVVTGLGELAQLCPCHHPHPVQVELVTGISTGRTWAT